jgi:hypothetical protein
MRRLTTPLVLIAMLAFSCSNAEPGAPDAANPGTGADDGGMSAGDADAGSADAGSADAGPDASSGPTPGPAVNLRIPVPGGSFESAPGEYEGLGQQWSKQVTDPTDTVVAMTEAGVSGETVVAADGTRALRLELRRAGGTTEGRVAVRSPLVGSVVPGVKYTLEARIYNDDSCGWAGSGPELGFVLSGTAQNFEIPISSLPSGQWTLAKAEYVAPSTSAGSVLEVQVQLRGFSNGTCWPRVVVDQMVLQMDMPGSFEVPNGSFESPVQGATDALPTGWSLAADATANRVTRVTASPDGALTFAAPQGSQALRMASLSDDWNQARLRLMSPVVTTAVAGRTYVVHASFFDPSSCQWATNGPEIGFSVADTWTSSPLNQVSIIGIKANGAGRFHGGAASWTARPSDAGKELRVGIEVSGVRAACGNPDILIDEVKVGSTP